MALTGSGQIKLSDIAAEYGGSVPHSLSEYHDKGNAPASGEIQLAADFYGTSNTFSFSITSNASQVNLRSTALSAGWDGSSQLLATINSGVIIYSGSTGTAAMTINGSYPGGVTLTNNGTILGKGGNGGSVSSSTCGCGCCTSGSTSAGSAGGTGLSISSAVTINNGSGRISGGGGGGGSGGQVNVWNQPGASGGGGIGNGAGGSGPRGGSSGSLTSAGGPGSRCICTEGTYLAGGAGGSGGSYGASGGGGGHSQCGGNTNCDQQSCCGAKGGGAGGAATSGQSNVTWSATGTRNGTVG